MAAALANGSLNGQPRQQRATQASPGGPYDGQGSSMDIISLEDTHYIVEGQAAQLRERERWERERQQQRAELLQMDIRQLEEWLHQGIVEGQERQRRPGGWQPMASTGSNLMNFTEMLDTQSPRPAIAMKPASTEYRELPVDRSNQQQATSSGGDTGGSQFGRKKEDLRAVFRQTVDRVQQGRNNGGGGDQDQRGPQQAEIRSGQVPVHLEGRVSMVVSASPVSARYIPEDELVELRPQDDEECDLGEEVRDQPSRRNTARDLAQGAEGTRGRRQTREPREGVVRRSNRERRGVNRYGTTQMVQRGNRERDEGPITGVFPLMDGNSGPPKYVPWSHKDMDGVVRKLPHLEEGAPAWIRVFEDITAQDNLGLGDLRALLIKCLGGSGPVRDLEEAIECDEEDDSTPFSKWRGDYWEELRAKYPQRKNVEKLLGMKIRDDEEMWAYLRRAKEAWIDATGESPQSSVAVKMIWRAQVAAGLGEEVKEKLKNVVGLDEMGDDLWKTNLLHYYEAHKKTKDSQAETIKSLEARLLKATVAKQETEINKQKAAKKVLMVQETPVGPPPAGPPQPPAETGPGPYPKQYFIHHPPVYPPQMGMWPPPQNGTPYPGEYYTAQATSYGPPPQRGGWGRGRGGQRGRSRGGRWSGPPRDNGCFNCGDQDHWVKECPKQYQGHWQGGPPTGSGPSMGQMTMGQFPRMPDQGNH